MSTEKEIRSKIRTVQNIQKITRAMQMVAVSKMRKAQLRMLASRPYMEKMLTVIRHIASIHMEQPHPYLKKRSVSRIGMVIISSDRGLCGGLNIHLFRKALSAIQRYEAQGMTVQLYLVGKKAEHFFQHVDRVVSISSKLGDAPDIKRIIGIVKLVLDNFEQGDIDRLYMCYNCFHSMVLQKGKKVQLLPLQAVEEKKTRCSWDYIYEPGAEDLLNMLFIRYIETSIYQGMVENLACEQAARMLAMKNATDNAGELIDEFQLAYNKARQASITQEVSEIVSGAAAT